MLSKMRDHRNNRVLQTIVYSMFGIIIIVFAISFGPGAWGQGGLTTATHAAKVNGTIITAVEFERAYGEYLEHYRRITGESLTPDQARGMGVRRGILDSLVDRKLVVQHATQMGIYVPDAEVSRTLREIEAFHTDGRFDQEIFERYVKNVLGSSTGRFFERVREDMLYQRVLEGVRATASVSPAEVWDRFVQDNDKVDLEHARFSPMRFRDKVEVTSEAIDELLGERQEDVAAYYERNSFKYKQPERVRARHVLISTDPDSSEAERTAARARARDVLQEARDGADFATLAREHSDDPGSRERGGDLDLFGRGQMVPTFEDAAFSLAPGELSDVVESPFGFHVILVEERRKAEEQALEEVSRDIAKEILQGELAKEMARSEAKTVLERARAGKSLSELLGEAEEGERAPPSISLGDGSGLDLGSIQAQLGASSARTGDNGAATTGLHPIKGGEIRGIGRSHDLASKVNALTTESPLVPDVVEVGGAYYVVRLIERQTPDKESFEAERSRLRDEVLRSRRGHVEEAFMATLRDGARIQINEALVSM